MPKAQLGTVVRYLRDVASRANCVAQTDRELLGAFMGRRDQAAFSALVKRHGPLVLAVCRRMLRNQQDSEDAFQATFLVLARQAASIRKEESLASWLHGVAYRMSSNARRAAARRRKYESQALAREVSNPSWTVAWQEVQLLVDEEIQRLPSIYREAFIQSCLENRSCVDVAQSLGQNEATVRSRVARARKQLQKRLVQRGISLSAVLSCVAIGSEAGAAEVPAALMQATVNAAVTWTQGSAAAGLVSAEVATLVKGATKSVLYAKLKLGAVVLLALGVGTASIGVPRHQVLAGAEQRPENEPPREVEAKQPELRLFDAFDGKWLANWKPVRFDPSHVSLTRFPGQLTITTQRGSIYEDHAARGEPIAKNLFLMDNPAAGNADFVLTTSISEFTPTAAYQQAAIICYDDDDNYVKLGYEFNHDQKEGQKIVLVCETDAHGKYYQGTAVSGLQRVWLRLTKRGNRYEYAASTDGKKYEVYGEEPWGNGAQKKLGILAKNGGLEGVPEIDARFDFFEFRSPPPPADPLTRPGEEVDREAVKGRAELLLRTHKLLFNNNP
jgi:RNA polymerase sigma factor (sigma-70 family)